MIKKSLLLYLASWIISILTFIAFIILIAIISILINTLSESFAILYILTLFEIPTYIFLIYQLNNKYFHLPLKTVIIVQASFIVTAASLTYLLILNFT